MRRGIFLFCVCERSLLQEDVSEKNNPPPPPVPTVSDTKGLDLI